MAIIQPVRGPDFGQLIGRGIQTFRGIQDIQRRGRQSEAEARLLGLNEAIAQDPTNPKLLAQLAVLDPGRARDIRQAADAADKRLDRERPRIASRIKGLPPAQQIQILDQQIQRITDRGDDPKRTQGLRDLIAGTPEQVQQAQGFIDTAIDQGIREGFLQPPAQPQQTGLVRNAIAAGLQPGTPEFRDFITKATLRPQTQISLGGGASEQKELGKIRAQEFRDIKTKADVAQTSLANLDILDSIDVSTGKAEPMKQAIAAFGASFGIDTSKLANVPAGEAFTAIAGKTVLDAMAAQKGPQTESDMLQIRQTVSGLSKDPRANTFINNSARALALRRVEQREFFQDFLARKDTLKGAASAWSKHISRVPMISRNLKTPVGLPLFFHKFEELMKERFGPGVSQEDIIFTWKAKDKAARKQ